MKRVSYLLLAFAACGDNLDNARPDGQSPDAAPDMTISPWSPPAPFGMALAPAGPDQLMSVTAGPSGTFYAAGYAAQTVAGAKLVIVVKLTAAGALDTTFATNGVYTSTLELEGGSDEIDIVTQSDGKIVVSATIANHVDAADRDVGLFRIDANGALDMTFGTLGIARVDLSTAHNTGTSLVGLDVSRSLAVGPSSTLFLHAATRAEGLTANNMPRTDTDFTVAKLTANGTLDLTWGGTDGKHSLDIQQSNATPRQLQVLADGSVIASGYANTPLFNTVQPVLYRLDPTGALATGFASGGVFHEAVLGFQTEIYAFAIDGDRLTTAGYGRQAMTPAANDWVSLRFDLTSGARDTNFGSAANGAVMIDPSEIMLGSNCRNAVALPGGKTALIGSTGPGNMPEQDAAFAIIKQNGQLDTGYAAGFHMVKMSATADGSDQFWGGAVSGGKLMLLGWKGAGATQTETLNDDAHGVVFSLLP
jgi:uncharacterized delta-60 repeat protein